MTTATETPVDRTRVPSPGSHGGTYAATGHDAASGIRNRTVLIYLALAVLALIPGLALRLGLDLPAETLPGRLVAALAQRLDDIRFGHGLRFWLGVTGATMMALLLLYPLRKVLGKTRGLGRIGGWFHLHIFIGFAGPVAILYHANFGHGGQNANVALWSMGLVAVSGIVGHFVYRRASAAFYGDKREARAELDAIRMNMLALPSVNPAALELMDAFEAFDARHLQPRPGVLASMRNRYDVEERRRFFSRALGALIAHASDVERLSPAEASHLRDTVGAHFRNYIRLARRGATRSVREQLWAKWRLFHLPFFLIMVVAVVLHVIAVWDMDAQPSQRAETTPAITSAAAAPVPKPTALGQKAVRTTKVDAASANSPPRVTNDKLATEPPRRDEIADLLGKDAKPAKRLPPPVAAKPAAAPAAPTEAARDIAGAPVLLAPPELVRGPPPIPQPVPVPPPSTIARAPVPGIDAAPKAPIEPPRPKSPIVQAERAPPPATPAPTPKPVVTPTERMPSMVEASPPPPAVSPPVASNAEVAELQRRTEPAQSKMSLGGAKDRSLTEQITLYKARMKAKEFFHSDAETGFALTGKHVKADCAQCHQKPLTEQRSENPRQCIACHKKDDVHRGRRPDCAACHTTNRWGERKR